MSFSIDPGNPDESIQETDKDKNNKKIVNLANPTDNEDAANKSMMMKTETIDLFSFLSKYAKRNFSLRHSSKKKQSCWYYTDKTHTVKYLSK